MEEKIVQYSCPYIYKDLLNRQEIIERYIYPNTELNFYWADDWSAEFYIELAYAGFIVTCVDVPNVGIILLPEIQFNYAVLDWGHVHMSKKVKSLLTQKRNQQNPFYLTVNADTDSVITGIDKYHGSNNWFHGSYIETIQRLRSIKDGKRNFALISLEIWDTKRCENLIAGEIGYTIGKTYTSLTGFFQRGTREYNNCGKVQLLSSAELLRQKGYSFWNLGHPYMQYKQDIGATILSRKEFLHIWKQARTEIASDPLINSIGNQYNCCELLLPNGI